MSYQPKPITVTYVDPDDYQGTLQPQPYQIIGIDPNGEGNSQDIAIGRNILTVDQSTDLAAVDDINDYSFVDVRVGSTTSSITIKLPSAEDYGHGRVLYINDKLGIVDPETYGARIRIEAVAGEGIDGRSAYTIGEKDGYVALRASETPEFGNQAWQVVGANPTANHTNSYFANHVLPAFTELNKGQVQRWSGAHVYIPLAYEVYSSYAAGKFLIRFYPTEAMANTDKDRAYGDPVPDGITVSSEIVCGGDLGPIGFAPGTAVSSWNASREPVNIRFIVFQQLSGTLSRLSGTATYLDLVQHQG